MMERKVNFIIVGNSKSGTHTMRNYLAQHPQICLSRYIEDHFFDYDYVFDMPGILVAPLMAYDSYNHSFDLKEEHKVMCDISPGYAFCPYSIPRIHYYNPNVKLLLILRNPITRAYSDWNHQMQSLKFSEDMSFLDVIRNEDIIKRAFRPTTGYLYPITCCFLARGFYCEQIRRIKSFFPDEQVKIVKLESLNEEGYRKKFFLELSEFLGIDKFDDTILWVKRNVHTHKIPMSREDKDYVKNIFYYEIKQLEQLLGWDCGDWLLV